MIVNKAIGKVAEIDTPSSPSMAVAVNGILAPSLYMKSKTRRGDRRDDWPDRQSSRELTSF
jgi:hypothetical protein